MAATAAVAASVAAATVSFRAPHPGARSLPSGCSNSGGSSCCVMAQQQLSRAAVTASVPDSTVEVASCLAGSSASRRSRGGSKHQQQQHQQQQLRQRTGRIGSILTPAAASACCVGCCSRIDFAAVPMAALVEGRFLTLASPSSHPLRPAFSSLSSSSLISQAGLNLRLRSSSTTTTSSSRTGTTNGGGSRRKRQQRRGVAGAGGRGPAAAGAARAELAGQYEESFADVEKRLLDFFTFKAVRVILRRAKQQQEQLDTQAAQDKGEAAGQQASPAAGDRETSSTSASPSSSSSSSSSSAFPEFEYSAEQEKEDLIWLAEFITSNKKYDSKLFIRSLVQERQGLAEKVMTMRLQLFNRWAKQYDHAAMHATIRDQNLELLRERLAQTVKFQTLEGEDAGSSESASS